MYMIMEDKSRDMIQVYEESEIHKGWKIILQTYGIEKFNKEERHKYTN